ncbi:MAG: helix-turn-helix domain-containing protein [Gemmatimonadetes bacterium]|nr:helix-turn-helix domain-containing protein [Gemmatimonadota bacterium]
MPPRTPDAVWLTAQEAAHHLGLRVQTLANWRKAGVGPRSYRPAPRVVRYRRDELDAWVAEAAARRVPAA